MLRNVRNNNPGNIDSGANWHGLMPREQMTPDQAAEPRFAVFQNPGWGFRALAEVLETYMERDGCHTVTAIISRWAPGNENNTAAYIRDVAWKAGYDPMVPLHCDQPTIRALAKAITSHETAGGKVYAESFDPFWKGSDLVWGVEQAFA